MRKHLISLADRLVASVQVIDGELEPDAPGTAYADFKRSRELYYKRDLKNVVDEFSRLNLDLLCKGNEDVVEELSPLVKQVSQLYAGGEKMALLDIATRIRQTVPKIKEAQGFSVSLPRLPLEISAEMMLDVQEIEKCFDAGCYRSVTILCGRILEVALHRKYYDVTGQDILETNPGIGLGKLIAKLREKDFGFDPGITEQIHLINQVRVSSVHKKREPFSPSREQAHAMVLYTMDVLGRLFSK
ncbi:MAG: hypothetical protein ABIC95_04600 [archaeon]